MAENSNAKLTFKQEAFLNAYLETGNASEAYRRAYNAKGMSATTIETEACKLLKHPKVSPRVRAAMEKAQVKSLLSLEDHMLELKALRDEARKANQFSAAITAETKRGELRKFYIKQVEHGQVGDFARMSDDELDSFLTEHAYILDATSPSDSAH